jgi:hypothetical protein
MNENKMAFIICSNDEVCMNECMKYINRLNVPEGIETDVIVVQGAESLCSGYNAAMNDSDAKYKVYMHQDVFILNLNFIADVINTFKSHPDYGMLGVIGADRIFQDANYWLEWNTGATRCGGFMDEKISHNIGKHEPYLMPVVAIDGMIMITQYDLPWREDLFDGFHFYDASQSFEFIKANYLVGVVPQPSVWCNHDCGWSGMRNYDYYRKIFCREYAGYGHKYEESETNIWQFESQDGLSKESYKFDKLLERGRDGDKTALDEIAAISNKYQQVDRKLGTYIIILNTLYDEWREGSDEFTMHGAVWSPEELLAQFRRYRYFLRRVEAGFPLEDDEVYKEIAARKDKRLIDLATIAGCSTIEPEATLKRLSEKIGGVKLF